MRIDYDWPDACANFWTWCFLYWNLSFPREWGVRIFGLCFYFQVRLRKTED